LKIKKDIANTAIATAKSLFLELMEYNRPKKHTYIFNGVGLSGN
jgi:hypothetical protein